MSRIQKKCLIASAGMHVLMLLVIAFGAAFQPEPKPQLFHRINVIPDIFKDGPPGGGGNPQVRRTEDMVKGNTLQPVEPAPPPPPKAQTPKPPTRQPESVRPVEPVKPPVKPTPTPTPTRPVTKVPDNLKLTPVKPLDKPVEKLALVPTVRTDAAKEKARREAEAREVARQAAQAEAKYRNELAQQFGKAAQNLKAGFASGTVDVVGGDGGPAHAEYVHLVEAVYRGALQQVTDFSDQDFTVKVEVVIARSGRVVSSRILRRSGNAVMDRAVQRALDKVEREGIGRPFPPDMREAERRYTFDYSFKARRATG